MEKYIVKPAQNLFDISLELYGTIEGAFDLLISNPKLNMTVDLQPGQEIEYHSTFKIRNDIIKAIKTDGIIPANSERHVYYKETSYPLIFMYGVNNEIPYTQLILGGEGNMEIDWGDNSQLEAITLTHTNVTLQHYFNNQTDSRRIKVYGNFKLTFLDSSMAGGNIFLLRPMVVDEFICRENDLMLQGLFLFEGTYKIDLQKSNIEDLNPIRDMSLSELDLRYVNFASVSVIDDYLEYIALNYGMRRHCTVYLTTEPTERGMRAINTIIHEPEWNRAGKWVFIINDKQYTA